MSTVVKSVYDAIKTEVSSTLGATWLELRYLFDVEKNDKRTLARGFGVVPLEAINNPSVLKTYTLDQGYEIILTRGDAREIDDSDKIDALLESGGLYDEASEIKKALINKQLGIPEIILNIANPNINAPEFTPSAVVLRFQLTVRWRENLS